MIYVTGDTHIPIDIQKLSRKNFPQQKQMTKEDYVIICGDFGGVWNKSNEEKYWLKWLSEANFTTLFIDGNHENHELLGGYPVTEFCGGRVHRIKPSIYHLMRGEVYTIDDKKIFTMGGASSHDKEHRKENISWWPQELPSGEEYEHAMDTLEKHDWDVDYVITHCAPRGIQTQIADWYVNDELIAFLQLIVKNSCRYKKWFFGHYHIDREIDDKHICVYDKIIQI